MRRILVVDDHEENLFLLTALLSKDGYQVETAANGAEALEKARKSPPDLVISDILMPVMDGFRLCREWVRDEVLGSRPFIFYTATYTDQKDEEFALSLGAARFIVKPQENAVFLGLVKTVLNEWAKGELNHRPVPQESEEIVLQQYNAVLIRKLESKIEELEASERRLQKANQDLSADLEARRRAEERAERRLAELQAWQSNVLDREDRLRELKKEVNSFLAELGRPPKYRDL